MSPVSSESVMTRDSMPNRITGTDVPSAGTEPSWKLFDRIAHRYDPLNRLLSFGTDQSWRKKLVQYLPDGPIHLLDMATGTGDQLLMLASLRSDLTGVGIDPSREMLAIAPAKAEKAGLQRRLSFLHGAAESIPFPDGSFDAVTISFGIRNVVDLRGSLREMTRVLRSNGRLIILEFSLPSNPMLRFGYLLYFRHILPRLGGLISGDPTAYRYLNKTVESFPYGDSFAAILREIGLEKVTTTPLTFGVATIYCGVKS